MLQERRDILGRHLPSRRTFGRASEGRDDRGWTLLHIVARKGDLNEVKRLLDEGMDVNVSACGPKSQGVTPLHLAAQGGHLEVMDELLERGADIDARTKGACGYVKGCIANITFRTILRNILQVVLSFREGTSVRGLGHRARAFTWLILTQPVQIRQSLGKSNADKVTSRGHSQGKRFLMQVTADADRKAASNGSVTNGKTSICPRKRSLETGKAEPNVAAKSFQSGAERKIARRSSENTIDSACSAQMNIFNNDR